MDTPVLKPGGFWVCPTCGGRNKVWAPCASCGTTLAGMDDVRAGVGEPAVQAPRRGALLYVLLAVGVVAAVALGLWLSRLLGGASLLEDASAPAGEASAATERARDERRAAAIPTPTPFSLPSETPRVPLPSPPPADILPATPPAAVYTPRDPGPAPGYSIPAPAPAAPPRTPLAEPRPGAGLRARQEAVRSAQVRYRRAEMDLTAAEGGDPEREAAALEALEQAARDLRDAEAALDRARRGRGGGP